ncbi:hypothetical protein GCM10008968_13760 [Bacillus horti]
MVLIPLMQARHIFTTDNTLLFNLSVASLILAVILIALTIYGRVSSPRSLHIEHDQIKIGERELRKDQIKEIVMYGYFQKNIGIKPVGRKLVPGNLAFKFVENKDEGVKEIKQWASQQDIKISHKRFMTWV